MKASGLALALFAALAISAACGREGEPTATRMPTATTGATQAPTATATPTPTITLTPMPTATATPISTPTPAPTPAPTFTPAPTPTPQTPSVPKVARSGQIELTIVAVHDPYEPPFGRAGAGMKFAVVRVVLKNISDSLGPSYEGFFSLQDEVGTVYSEGPPAPGVEWRSVPQLAPGDSAETSYTFQIPSARRAVSLRWEPPGYPSTPVTITFE